MKTHASLTLREATTRSLLEEIVESGDVDRLSGVPLWQLMRPGFGGEAALLEVAEASRRRLGAAFELARRSTETRPAAVVRSAGDAVRVLGPGLAAEAVEVFRVLLLDARHRLIAAPEISRGTLSASLVHPREVFRPALLVCAAAVIVAHNHPSGESTPSPEDDAVTERLASAAQILGIPLLDHVVLGVGEHFSYAAQRASLLRPPVKKADRLEDGGSPMTKPERRGLHFDVNRFGRVGLIFEASQLVRLLLPGGGGHPLEALEVEGVAMEEATGSEPLVQALRGYFLGEEVDPATLEAGIDWERFTPFARRVYTELRQVRRGETISYGELARRAGSPRAARGVGQVMARNPIPLLIPCHRVLSSNGGLGGFSSARGLSDKKALLRLESGREEGA